MERLKLLLAFLSENPDDFFIFFGIAKEYEKLGTADEAIRLVEKIKLNDPNSLDLYYH